VAPCACTIALLAAMPSLKLTYFGIQGPAEASRLALTIAGIPFDDVRIDRDTMLKMREEGKLSVAGVAGTQVPQLEVDGKILQQSQAIATYCAKLANLYPSDPWDAAKADEATQFIIQDIRGRLIEPTMRIDDAQEKAKARAELNDTKLPEKFAILDALLAPSGFLVGDSLTIADLHLYVLCNWIGMGTIDGVSKEMLLKFNNVAAFVKKVNELEKVKAWNAEKNPKLPWC